MNVLYVRKKQLCHRVCGCLQNGEIGNVCAVRTLEITRKLFNDIHAYGALYKCKKCGFTFYIMYIYV